MSIDVKSKKVTFLETVTVREFEPYLTKNKTDDQFFATYESQLEEENALVSSTLALFEENQVHLDLLDRNYDLYAHNMSRKEIVEIHKMIRHLVKKEHQRLSCLYDILDSTIDSPRIETIEKAIQVATRFIAAATRHERNWLRAADMKELEDKNFLPYQGTPFTRLVQVESLEPNSKRYRLFTNQFPETI